MARAAGITLASPFLDPRVVALAASAGVDREKSALRAAASEVLPAEILERPKVPCFMPNLDLTRFRDPKADARLEEVLKRPAPTGRPDPESTLWSTATLLFQQIGGLS